MGTKIHWTDETINPVVGCSKMSSGCASCYAEIIARRLAAMGLEQYQGVISFGKWNGLTAFVPSELEKPYKWKAHRSVFVSSMGDLFHKTVPFGWVDEVMRMVWDNPRHTFIVLTKRPENMRRYFTGLATSGLTAEASKRLLQNINYARQDHGWHLRYLRGGALHNLVCGVSVEDQQTADDRIPVLLEIPAAKRFISLEPMVGPVSLRPDDLKRLDGVILGGESGNKARYLNPTWVRTIRDQCAEAGTPFMFKQWAQMQRTEENLHRPSGFPRLDGKIHTDLAWKVRK